MGIDFVRNGNVFQTDSDHFGAGGFTAFADGIGDFAGFAEADTDPATLVADDDESAEIEAASAFDDLGGAIDEDDLLNQVLPLIAVRSRFRLGTTAPAAARAAIGPGLFCRSFCFCWFSHSDASLLLLKLQSG